MAQEFPDTDSIKAFNQSIADEFRANDGKVGGQFEGANLLLLTTTGAKSGQPRLSPLAYFRIDGKLIIIGSFAGADVNPAWVHNLRANPSAQRRDRQRLLRRDRPRTAAAERDELSPKIDRGRTGFRRVSGEDDAGHPGLRAAAGQLARPDS